MTDLIQRPRRLRKSPALRAMFEETTLSLNDLVLPIFVEEEIDESESRRPTVDQGKIKIDETDNYLLYGDSAAIVNVSAFSIKALYNTFLSLEKRLIKFNISFLI